MSHFSNIRVRWQSYLLALSLTACGTHGAGPTPTNPNFPFAGMTRGTQVVMGARLSIALNAPRGVDGARLLRQAFEAAIALDALLSSHKADSALTRLNQRRQGHAPAKLRRFLGVSKRLCRATVGAFDIGVGKLVEARSADERLTSRPPDDCGAYALEGDTAKLAPGVRLTSGAIGKGYAVDAIVSLLRKAGVKRAFIDFGGSSFYGLGKGWKIAVESSQPGRVLGSLELENCAFSSSKSLGSRGPHIVDPRSGALVRELRIAAVSSPSATEAEALSTALVVRPTLLKSLRARFPTDRLLVQIGDAPPRGDTAQLTPIAPVSRQ